MKTIDMKITKEIDVLSVSGSGYTKEINLVSWNTVRSQSTIFAAGRRDGKSAARALC